MDSEREHKQGLVLKIERKSAKLSMRANDYLYLPFSLLFILWAIKTISMKINFCSQLLVGGHKEMASIFADQ